MYSQRSYTVSSRKPQVSNYNIAVFENKHYFYGKLINDLRKANVLRRF